MTLSRKFLGISIAIIVVALLAGGAYWRLAMDGEGDDADGQDEELPEILSAARSFATDIANPVEGWEVVRDTLVLSVTAEGEAVARRAATLRAQVEGPVRELLVRESDYVDPNDTLLRIASREYELQLQSAELSHRQAQLRFEQLTFGNDDFDDPTIREDRMANARVESGLASGEIELERARLNLARTSVVPPFAGRVADVLAVPGAWVSAGDELLTVLDIDPIRVDVYALESELRHLVAGNRASVRFQAFPDTTFEGRIETINPRVDRQTGQARVTVTVSNPDGRIVPGMYAEAALEAQKIPDRILVPRTAVLERNEDRRPMVFVLRPDEEGALTGTAEWVYVRPGLANDSLYELVPDPDLVNDGMLEPGVIVLTGGHGTLTHNARVRLVENVRREGGRPN